MNRFLNRRRRPQSRSENLFDFGNALLLVLFALFCIYPVYYTLINTFTAPEVIQKTSVVLYPPKLSVGNFKYILREEHLLCSYVNSFIYTACVTVYSTSLTVLGAYVLSRRHLIGRNVFMFLIWFTMVFSGGLIPTYLVINSLGLIDTVWAVILPCAVSQYNLIVMRTSMAAIPQPLEDAARIDGCGHVRMLLSVVLPVSLPTLATIALFNCVGQWNSYFKEMIYLNHKEMYPLQLILRELLVTYTATGTDAMKMSAAEQSSFAPLGFKCAVIFISMLPMLILYPFVQRFFIKGIMIGSIKG